MSLNLRIFLAYFLIVGVAFYLFINVLISEMKPGFRQSTEESLVDMSNLLAELVADQLVEEKFVFNHLEQNSFGKSVDRFLSRIHEAKIYSVEKQGSKVRIYITDDQGIVRYDSDKIAVGQDYSTWNDVYLTLQGKYGARSTLSDPDNKYSTVMHVAAPIKYGEKILGVLTVAKPNQSVQPYIDAAREKIQMRGLGLLVLSLIAAVMLSYWLTASIRRLAAYADQIGRGERALVPDVRESELAKLARSIDSMRNKLEGKEYVERYIHALTHELKSPVSAIKGAAEIISPVMPAEDMAKFMSNIQYEIERIDEMINRLLALASVEKQDVLLHIDEVNLVAVANAVLESKQVVLGKKRLGVVSKLPSSALILGDKFLVTQALDNILQNAIDFSPLNGRIELDIDFKQSEQVTLMVKDQGEGIPQYAIDKVFDRFYSLARPYSQKKSSGLGLCFVRQIMTLHHGDITIENQKEGGTLATLSWPLNN